MQFDTAFQIIWARRNAVIAVLLAGVIAAVIGLRLSRPTYAATATVLMNASSAQGTTVSDGGFLGSDMPSLLLSDTILSRFAAQQHLGRVSFTNLRKSISADIMPESAVMPITYKAKLASTAIAGANALADDLRAYYREISTRRYDDLATYLSTALDGERAKIEATDRQLDRLIASDPYFTQSEAAQAIGAQVLALNQQRDQIDATMESHAVQAALAGRRVSDLMPSVKSELRTSDPDYSTLANQVAKDRSAEAILRAQYTGKYAGITALQDQIARSTATLDAERKRAESEDPANSATYGALIRDRDTAAAIYAGDGAQRAAIERQIEVAESHLAQLPRIGARVASLRRDHDAAVTAYQILAEQRTLTLSQQAQTAALGSITIADRATIAEPSIGKGALLVPVAAMLAFTVLALALPFGLELIDQRLRRRETIETLYGRPLLGTVPA